MDNILIFDHIDMSFYDLKKETKVLKDLSFTINKGNIYVLIGPSGCGKTFLAKAIPHQFKINFVQIISPKR